MHNLKNPDVLCNIALNPHIYLMKDGTFMFEDEHGFLTSDNYDTFVSAKSAFQKYCHQTFGEYADPIDSEIRARREISRRVELASVLRGLRTTFRMLVLSTDNFNFHQNNDNALHTASIVSDNMAEYADLLDPVVAL